MTLEKAMQQQIAVEQWILHARHHKMEWVDAFERNFIAQKWPTALKTETYPNVPLLLNNAFIWLNTPEGYDYWARIYLENNKNRTPWMQAPTITQD
jgi:hypothetical protein